MVYCINLSHTCYFFCRTIYLGYVKPSSIPKDWWSALAVVSTLSFAIIVITYFREKEFIDTNRKYEDSYTEVLTELNELKEIASKNRELASLSTLLLDITTDNYSNKEKWEENYGFIKNLFKSGIISDHNLFRISMEAWKQNAIAFAFRLRMLALNQNTQDDKTYWKIRILEILPYVDNNTIIRYDPNELITNFDDLNLIFKYFNYDIKSRKYGLREIIKKISFSNEDPFLALLARYEYKKGNFENARILLERYYETTILTNIWTYRIILGIYLRNNEKKLFKKCLKELEEINDSRSEPSYTTQLYIQLMNNILSIWNGSKQHNPFNKSLLIRMFNVPPINIFTMWHFYDDIQNSNFSKPKKQLIFDNYKVF